MGEESSVLIGAALLAADAETVAAGLVVGAGGLAGKNPGLAVGGGFLAGSGAAAYGATGISSGDDCG